MRGVDRRVTELREKAARHKSLAERLRVEADRLEDEPVSHIEGRKGLYYSKNPKVQAEFVRRVNSLAQMYPLQIAIDQARWDMDARIVGLANVLGSVAAVQRLTGQSTMMMHIRANRVLRRKLNPIENYAATEIIFT